MTHEKLITQLCEVIKESEVNATDIYSKMEQILELCLTITEENTKSKINNILFDAMNLIQLQDLHRQKIERVVNFVCEEHNINPEKFNIAKSANCIDKNDVDDFMSEDELAKLVEEMTQ